MRIGKARLAKVLTIIGQMFPEAKGELDWETPFQLLIAVILSAQTTDKAVNKVTPGLWQSYPEIEDLAFAELSDVENALRTIGLYKNKAKNIIKTAQAIRDDFKGQVPKPTKSLKVYRVLAEKQPMWYWQRFMVFQLLRLILMWLESQRGSIFHHQMPMSSRLKQI